MIKMMLLTIFVGLLTSLSFAQGVEREIDVFPEQASIEHNEAVKKFSRDYVSSGIMSSSASSFINSILQADQLAIINQIGNFNVASINQSGVNNYAVINLIGDRNNVGITQDGQWNVASLSVIGDENSLQLNQDGYFNLFKRVYVTDGIEGRFSQSGFGLDLEIIGSNGIPLSIEQTGQGSGILIENYN